LSVEGLGVRKGLAFRKRGVVSVLGRWASFGIYKMSRDKGLGWGAGIRGSGRSAGLRV